MHNTPLVTMLWTETQNFRLTYRAHFFVVWAAMFVVRFPFAQRSRGSYVGGNLEYLMGCLHEGKRPVVLF